jgi:metallo-beta-lactamase family protein
MFGDPRNLLCLVGWAAPHSLGARLGGGQDPVLVRYREGGELRQDWIAPVCAVERYHCFSGHADQRELLAWLRNMRGVRRVFLVHGEPDEMEALARCIDDELGVGVAIPRAGERAVLRTAPAAVASETQTAGPAVLSGVAVRL